MLFTVVSFSNESITDENLTRWRTEESDNHRVAKTITTFHWQQHQWVASSSWMCCEEWRCTYQTLQTRL